MATKTKKTKAASVGQVYREVSTRRQVRVVGLGSKFAACTYRLGHTGRFTALSEDVLLTNLLSRRYVLIRG